MFVFFCSRDRLERKSSSTRRDGPRHNPVRTNRPENTDCNLTGPLRSATWWPVYVDHFWLEVEGGVIFSDCLPAYPSFLPILQNYLKCSWMNLKMSGNTLTSGSYRGFLGIPTKNQWKFRRKLCDLDQVSAIFIFQNHRKKSPNISKILRDP